MADDFKDGGDVQVLDAQGGNDGADEQKTGGDDGATSKDVNVSGFGADFEPEIKDHPSISKFKNANDLAKSYLHLETKLGSGKVVVPTDKSTDEDWEAFYAAGGRPKSADGYAIPEVKLPEGMKMLEGGNERLATIAHESGMNQKQFEKVYKAYTDEKIQEFKQAHEGAIEARTTAENELRKEWGAAYDAKVKLAERTFMSVADDNAKKLFNQDGFGNDPSVIKMFAELGAKLSEDNLGEGKKGEGLLTPEEAKSEIATIQGNKTHPYWDKGHPEHKFAVARMNALHEMAYPEEKTDAIMD